MDRRRQRRRMRRKSRNRLAVVTLAGVAAAVLATAFAMRLLPPDAAGAHAPQAGANQAQAGGGEAGGDWRLRLASAAHPLPADFSVETVPAGNRYKQVQFDKRAAPDLEALLEACNSEGYQLMPCSGYRDVAYQTGLFERQVKQEEDRGAPEEDARSAAATVVAEPGTSEHNLGLAVDFGTVDNQKIDESFAQEPVFQWLQENAWKYGFILRYPQDKESVTGIVYEPWHYRYVGKEAAEQIHSRGVCLEEYLGK